MKPMISPANPAGALPDTAAPNTVNTRIAVPITSAAKPIASPAFAFNRTINAEAYMMPLGGPEFWLQAELQDCMDRLIRTHFRDVLAMPRAPYPSVELSGRMTSSAGRCYADTGTIKIATQSPLSGGQSLLGIAIKQGAELALEQLGGDLRAMGYDVQLAPYDDQATPDVGVANAKNIVADSEILCGVGHLNSGVMIPSSEEYHTAGLAFVSPANTNPVVTTRGYLEVNRVVGRDDVQAPVAEQYAFETLGATSVYIIHDKTAYGQGVAEFFRVAAEEDGMSVLGFEGTEETANFDAIVTPLIAAAPDVVFFSGIYNQAGVFFKQAREAGYEGTFLGTDGMDASDLAELAGDALTSGGGMDTVTDFNGSEGDLLLGGGFASLLEFGAEPNDERLAD